MDTGSFPGVKSGRGLTLTPHPFLVPWSRKSRTIILLPPWAVHPVQSHSACTRVHFTFYFIPLSWNCSRLLIVMTDMLFRGFLIPHYLINDPVSGGMLNIFNPLNPELTPICYLLALLGAHHFLHVSRIRVKSLTFR